MKTLFLMVLVAGLSGLESQAAHIKGEVMITNKSGSLLKNRSDVVVFVEGKGLEKSTKKKEVYSMASDRKKFVPKVLPIVNGSEVVFPNNDRILHNVFSLSKLNPFDLGLYKKGVRKAVDFNKSGLIKVYCNIHEKMVGYVLVLDNGYFAKTDPSGKFEIKNLPKGEYKVTAWHWSSAAQSKSITIGDKDQDVKFDLAKQGNLSFNLSQKKTAEKHKNKWGKKYKNKY